MIKSEFITYKNLSNKNIIGVYDHIGSSKEPKPFIIIPPAFGETKTDSLSLSYFLVMNSFNVVRYDGTNHTGESDGDMFDFRLDEGMNDLIDSIDFIEREFKANTIGVVAKSLAWRFALKAAIQDRRIKLLLGIGGIVNLQETLKSVYQEDIVDMVLKKKYKGWKLTDIFGFEINRDFLETAIHDNYHDIKSTKDDFKKLTIPATFLYAEKDVWVDIEDIKEIIGGEKFKTDLYIIPQALHQIDENPLAALFVFRQTVVNCKKYLYKENIDPDNVVKPDIRKVASQNRLEKERLKPYELTKEKEKKFWQKYLPKYSFINKMRDFSEYLDTIVELFGETREDEVILDAGCGPGYFGTWLFGRSKDKSPFYIGIDIVRPILKKARLEHTKIITSISKAGYINRNSSKLSYICGDLDTSWNSISNSSICFKSKTFDKICCSLLISYLQTPLFLLNECFRILKPNGKIIITTLKPYADLSQIYRNFTTQTKNKTDIKMARKLLSSAGMIKLKESQGYYQFYSEKDLTTLLKRGKFKDIKLYRTFGNQVNLAVAIKK